MTQALPSFVLRLLARVRHWPWLGTLLTLVRRFREDHLALSAGSLTFTTIISLVPLATVVLAIFTAFPVFGTLQEALQRWLIAALVPDTIARQVLGAVTQFSSRANRLGAVGLGALVVSSLALMLTIDRTLNAIWRVRRPRPLAQRILVYWAALTLGPLLIAASLGATSFAISISSGYVFALPKGLGVVVGWVDFALMSLGMAALFHFVPNTNVNWRHALIGGVTVAIGMALAKRLLAAWWAAVPTYSMVYGAFATLPILLVWMYVSWCVVLTGAVIAAYLPVARMRVTRWPEVAGSRFQLGVAILRELEAARQGGDAGVRDDLLALRLRTDPLQVETIVQVLVDLDLVGRLADEASPRLILLRDPAQVPAGPMLDALLLSPSPEVDVFRARAGFDRMRLGELMADQPAAPSAAPAAPAAPAADRRAAA